MDFDDQAEELRAKLFNLRETRPASHIYLLLDNSHPVSPDHPLHPARLDARAIQRERTPLPSKPQVEVNDWSPFLLKLYCSGENGYIDEELIDLSVATALERCASINGTYMAAWIATDMSLSQLASQLDRSCQLFDFHAGRRRNMALYEPHRMALLLDDADAQRYLQRFLARIHLWGFIDAAGALRTTGTLDAVLLALPEQSRADTEPSDSRLSLAQCRAQARITMGRRVLVGLSEAELSVPAKAETIIDSLLVEASRLGLTHAEDVVFFALNGLSLSPEWHVHPQAQHCIRQTHDEGAALTGLLRALPDAVLDEIGRYRHS